MAHFLSGRMLFGPSDMNINIKSKSLETTQAAWSIAKILRLVGEGISWGNYNRSSPYLEEMQLAQIVLDRGFVKVGSLEEELEKGLNNSVVSAHCLDFIRKLLTLDPEKRPTAKEMLEHPWLRDV